MGLYLQPFLLCRSAAMISYIIWVINYQKYQLALVSTIMVYHILCNTVYFFRYLTTYSGLDGIMILVNSTLYLSIT